MARYIRFWRKVLTSHNIKYYLIGANARDVQLYKAGLKPARKHRWYWFCSNGYLTWKIWCVCSMNSVVEVSKKQLKATDSYTIKNDTILDLLPYGENWTKTLYREFWCTWYFIICSRFQRSRWTSRRSNHQRSWLFTTKLPPVVGFNNSQIGFLEW